MQDIIEQIKTYARGVWRYRWRLQLVAWPICLGGWLLVSLLPDQYEANARVYVDTQSMLRPVLKDLAVQTNVQEEIRIMTRTLLSRPNLEKVARMTDMDLKATTPEDMEDLINGLSRAIELEGRGQDNLYTVSYTHSNPQLAKQVVQSIITIFVESTLGDSRKDTNVAQRFLDDQIREYEERLLRAEERLKEFKRQNVGLMPQDGRDYYQRLQDAQSQLNQAELLLREATRRRDELQRQLGGEEPTFGLAGDMQTVSHPLDSRINSLESKLDELRLIYTEQHPDVRAVKETIAQLEDEKQEDLRAGGGSSGVSALNANPVYQQTKIALGEAEAEVAALEVRVDDFRNRVSNLRRAVDTIPKIEAELARLNRDYSINKKNYEALLAKRESVKLSEQADQSSDDVKFKVIDPPRVGKDPVGPNRPLFMSVVLVGGIGAGIAFAVFLSQLTPVFDSKRMLRRDLGLPVLGHISMVWAPKQVKARFAEASGFVLSGAVLVAIFVVLVALQAQGINALGSLLMSEGPV